MWRPGGQARPGKTCCNPYRLAILHIERDTIHSPIILSVQTKTPMAAKTLSGACACGASSYVFTHSTPPQHLDFCYCTMCQRSAGAPFMAWTGVAKEGLSLHGPIATFKLSSVAERTFCSKCGGNLTLQYACYPQKTHLAVATVRESDWELPTVGVHIFVKSCPKWYVIPEDGVARYDEFDDEFEAQFPEVVKMLK